MTTADRNQMLWNCAGFGIPLAELESGKSPGKTLAAFLRPDSPEPIEVVSEEAWWQTSPKALKAAGIAGEALKMKLKSLRQKDQELGAAWL